MNRCLALLTSLSSPARACTLTMAAVLSTALLPVSVQAQSSPAGLAQLRPFPEHAQRGILRLEAAPGGGVQARLNHNAVLLAPGFRLLSPQNGLVPAHQALNTNFTVNYVLESATGFLHTAWMLTPEEAAVPRAGASDGVQRNFQFASD